MPNVSGLPYGQSPFLETKNNAFIVFIVRIPRPKNQVHCHKSCNLSADVLFEDTITLQGHLYSHESSSFNTDLHGPLKKSL